MQVVPQTELNEQASKRKRRNWFLAIGAIALIGLGGLFALRTESPAEANQDGLSSSEQLVTVTAATVQEFLRTAPVSGEARPVKDIRVFAPVPGVRIAELLVDVGDHVEEGQPLARLDMKVVDAQVKEAEALLHNAQVEYRRAAEDYARIEPIAETGALSAEEVATRRATMDAANARLSAQRAAYDQIGARMQGGFVRAPASGLIIERSARIGEYADQSALFRIVGGNRLEVAASVSEVDILTLKPGQTALFKASGGAAVEATLRIAPASVDSKTRSGEALFDLPADASIRAGMYLRGEVVTDKFDALAVMQTAITYAAGEPGVFVIKDGKAHLIPVKLGALNENRVAVLEGLREGDLVASTGGAFLQNGESVRTVEAKANSGAAPVPRTAE